MKRQDTLEKTFLFSGLKINDKQVFPLSANRRTFLKIMGNEMFGGKDDTASVEECASEALFACTKNEDELGQYLDDKECWKLDCERFAVTSKNHTIERFMDMLMHEQEALKMGAVESAGKEEALEPSHA